MHEQLTYVFSQPRVCATPIHNVSIILIFIFIFLSLVAKQLLFLYAFHKLSQQKHILECLFSNISFDNC